MGHLAGEACSTHRIRVLFVDDEQRILDGLSRLFRSKRDTWSVDVACGGTAALEALAREPFDVVVSDMRMPGMDGVELLSRVKEQYPETVRVILSGQADESEVMRVVGASHRYVSKPCEPEVIEAIVGRAQALKASLANPGLRILISRLDTLPVLPEVYQDLVARLESGDSSPGAIGDVLSRDPGMTASVLKVVNSAFFGLRREVSNVAQAVSLLGTQTLQTLVLAEGVFRQFNGTRAVTGLRRISEHSFSTARACRALARVEALEPSAQDVLFTSAMLHDLGKLVLCAHDPELYDEIVQESEAEAVPTWTIEERRLDVDHGAVGAYLIGLWGLPAPIVEAVAWHTAPGTVVPDHARMAALVHVADAVVDGATRGRSGPDDRDRFFVDWAFLEDAGLRDRWASWRDACLVELDPDRS